MNALKPDLIIDFGSTGASYVALAGAKSSALVLSVVHTEYSIRAGMRQKIE